MQREVSKIASEQYSRQLLAEIERYRHVDDVAADLPGIFHLWSPKYVRPIAETVFGISIRGMEDFFAKYIKRYAAENPSKSAAILSIGAGNGDLEVRIAKLLITAGLRDFQFECMDINPAMLDRGRNSAREEQISEHFTFSQEDVAEWSPTRSAGVVMAHHSLHHIQDLERTFDNIFNVIGEDGYFLACDMIGRNGHMRWPEALAVIGDIWTTVPERYKYNNQSKRFETEFENVDCSTEGFEGIRAQDILPLLLKRFHFEAFAAYGNLPDVFVERAFGPNLNQENPEDVAFIERISELNDRLISEGAIKPTQMMAVMRPRAVKSPKCYLHWTPAFCVRTPPLYCSSLVQSEFSKGDDVPIPVNGPGTQESSAVGFWRDGWIAEVFEVAIRAGNSLEGVIIHGFLPEGRQSVELSLRINAATSLLRRVSVGSFSLHLPVDFLCGEVLFVQIACRGSFCPAEAGISSDPRKLGFVLREIQLVSRTQSQALWPRLRQALTRPLRRAASAC